MANKRVETGRGRKPGVVKASKKSSTSNRAFYLLIGIIAVAGIGALTYLSTRPSGAAAAASPIDTTLPKIESQGYVDRQPHRAARGDRVRRFRVPAVRPLRVDHRARHPQSAREHRKDSLPLHRLPAADAREHLECVARRGVRRRAGQVLGDARRDLREAGSLERRGDEEPGQGSQAARRADRAQDRRVRPVHRHEEDAGQGAGALRRSRPSARSTPRRRS